MKSVRELFTSKQLFVEITIVVAAAVACSAFLYSDAYASCCRDNDTFSYLFLPAALVAMVIGNGVHNAGHGSFTVGLIIQFVVCWLLIRILVAGVIKVVESR